MLADLHITNLRIIRDARLRPGSGINLVTGDNGSGKTTLLEAIYLLSRGRSFRHRESIPLIREGTESVQLVAKLESEAVGRHVIGMARSNQDVRVRVDGRAAGRRSDVLRLLPVQWIGPDPQSLLTAAPDTRRSFIDQGLFHVEHKYLGVLQNYHRALDQRNAELRRGGDNLEGWEIQMDEAATELDRLRRGYLEQLVAKVEKLLGAWKLDLDVQTRYQRGWREGERLGDILRDSRQVDRKQRFTGTGAHRADLVVKSASLRSGRRLSRGQLKMLACAWYFGQSQLAAEHGVHSEILLFDDLASELDEANRRKLLLEICNTYAQAFVTSLTINELPLENLAPVMFHVEHGVFSHTGGAVT